MAEKKRLTEKSYPPTDACIQTFMGTDAWQRLVRFESMLNKSYDVTRQLKFPFGSDYGWGYRYAHKTSLLLYVFFEENGFSCTLSINDTGAKKIDSIFDTLLPEIQEAWKNRYPCGLQGGWIHRSVASDSELPDLIRLVAVKVMRPHHVRFATTNRPS